MVIHGSMTVGNLVAFMLYTMQIGASIGMLSGLIGSIFAAQGASKRTFQLIDRDPQIPSFGGHDPDNPDSADPGAGALALGSGSTDKRGSKAQVGARLRKKHLEKGGEASETKNEERLLKRAPCDAALSCWSP